MSRHLHVQRMSLRRPNSKQQQNNTNDYFPQRAILLLKLLQQIQQNLGGITPAISNKLLSKLTIIVN